MQPKVIIKEVNPETYVISAVSDKGKYSETITHDNLGWTGIDIAISLAQNLAEMFGVEVEYVVDDD